MVTIRRSSRGCPLINLPGSDHCLTASPPPSNRRTPCDSSKRSTSSRNSSGTFTVQVVRFFTKTNEPRA